MQTSSHNNTDRVPAIAATILGRRGVGNQFRACLSLVACCGMFQSAAAELQAIAADDVVVINDAPAAGHMEQQFRAQFEPVLQVELSFVNRVCKLTADQRRILVVKSNAWLTKVVADCAKQAARPQAIGLLFGDGKPQPANPRESIQAGVARLVKAELPKDQAELYADESTKRAEFNKQAFVENFVTRLDNELILSPGQRGKITKSLTEHWDKNWQPQLEIFAHGMDMWPSVPDQWIRPHLTAVQQIAWGRLNKQNGNMFLGEFQLDGQVIDDIDLKEGQEVKDEMATGETCGAAASFVPVPAN
jgi:hypothetical protein